MRNRDNETVVSTRRPRTRALAAAGIALACCALPLTGCAPPLQDRPSASSSAPASLETAEPHDEDAVAERFAEIESRAGVALGVHAVDAATGRAISHRADERFAFASTLKALAAGVVLRTASADQLDAPRPVVADDIVTFSPILESRAGEATTLREAADAAVRYSDNTAANILVDFLGGPKALESQLRELGDETTSVDRDEPELNDTAPDDIRDTSTPRALATTFAALAHGSALGDGDRATFVDLLVRNTTGDALIRAGVPQGWTVGDKTGSASWGTRNDLGIAWPEDGGAPIILAVMTRGSHEDAEGVDAVVAEATAAIFEAFGQD